jgi:thiol-disulfide isomerase/thioredoxin
MLAFVLAALVNTTPPKLHEGSVPPSFPQLAQARGKTVVINFWATWCKPCTDELQYFRQAHDEYGNRIVIITISDEMHEVASSYLRTWDVDVPVIEDSGDALAKLYGVPPIPLTIVVRPDGTVGHVSYGELDKGELQAAIDAALATPVPGSPAPGVLR